MQNKQQHHVDSSNIVQILIETDLPQNLKKNKISGIDERLFALTLIQLIIDENKSFTKAWALCETLIDDYHLQTRDKAFIRKIVLLLLRNKPEIDLLIERYIKKWPRKKRDCHLLRLSICQLILLKTPPYSIIATTLGLIGKDNPARKLIHGVISKMNKDQASLQSIENHKFGGFSKKFYQMLHQNTGGYFIHEEIIEIRKSSLSLPSIDIALKDKFLSKRDQICDEIKGKPIGYQAIRLDGDNNKRLEEYASYQDGMWWVQDIAAQLAVQVLASRPNAHTFDLCSAPGGKTMQLLSAKANVTSIDIDQERLKRMHENLIRTKLIDSSITIMQQDVLTWQGSGDYILLDAPCSASGTLRKNPEIIFRFDQINFTKLLKLQLDLLQHAAANLSENGTLVYCVCSIFKQEGALQVKNFLKSTLDFQIDPVSASELINLCGNQKLGTTKLTKSLQKDGTLLTNPSMGVDGFYIARLKKCHPSSKQYN